MPTYVALLRGILPTNPNMRNEKFRSLFEELGFRNVKTVIASGNVIFSSPETNASMLERKIEQAFPCKLGFESATIIRSQQELEALIASKPFGSLEDTPHSKLQVTFLKDERGVATPLPSPAEGKSYALVGGTKNTLFSTIDLSGDKTPDLMTWLEKNFSKKITTRTWKTVVKIVTSMQAITP